MTEREQPCKHERVEFIRSTWKAPEMRCSDCDTTVTFTADPPAPPVPEIVVSEEAVDAYRECRNVQKLSTRDGLSRAFVLLLRANPALVLAEATRIAEAGGTPGCYFASRSRLVAHIDAEIRRRIETYVTRMPHMSQHLIDADRNWLLAALGVTP